MPDKKDSSLLKWSFRFPFLFENNTQAERFGFSFLWDKRFYDRDDYNTFLGVWFWSLTVNRVVPLSVVYTVQLFTFDMRAQLLNVAASVARTSNTNMTLNPLAQKTKQKVIFGRALLGIIHARKTLSNNFISHWRLSTCIFNTNTARRT